LTTVNFLDNLTMVILWGDPMPKSILVFCLHPAPGSFNHALADEIAEGARGAGHDVTRLNLSAMQFDADFGQSGFKGAKPPEPDLEAALQAIGAAAHVVLVTPMWWGGLPARAKGFFDRAFLPGRTFYPRIRKGGLPKPLLAGRTARLVMTSDTPGFWFRLMYGQALRKQVERQILSFCGLKPQGFTHFSPVEHSTAEIRARWLERARAIGAAGG
jgi:putative NADPH-quinone reductase